MLQRSVDFDSTVVLEVRRSHILKDALREARKLKFTTTKLVKFPDTIHFWNQAKDWKGDENLTCTHKQIKAVKVRESETSGKCKMIREKKAKAKKYRAEWRILAR